MSENPAEAEMRFELMAEIAKNELDHEQCSEETGRYNREFLYSVRDLEQLCSVTECPLTSGQLKDFGIFTQEETKKKNIAAKMWTTMKEKFTRRPRVKEVPARIEEEKNEEEIMKLREEVARITKEKAVAEERLRRSEEARLKMDRELKAERERKLVREMERQIRKVDDRIERDKIKNEITIIREEAARKEEEKAETDEREKKAREEKERIEKEEERKRKVEEKRRLMNEAGVFPLLALPDKLKAQIYRYIDLEGRHALRINEELAEIELKTEYRCKRLMITKKGDHVELRTLTESATIPHSEVEMELVIMGKNTHFDEVIYNSVKSEDRQIITGISTLKTELITVLSDPKFNDTELQTIVENKERVGIYKDAPVSVNGLMWIYENMQEGQSKLKWAYIYVPENVRWNFLNIFGNFNKESLTFTGTNPNPSVHVDDVDVNIKHENLKVSINKKDKNGNIGRIWFRVCV